MEAYTAFAKVYDKFMQDVPYERWADFIDFAVSQMGISKADRNSTDALESERNLVLDMGCGTGVLTRLMYDKGYDLIGVDYSQEMLDVASSSSDGREILYICQDMCELDLYSTIGTVYSTCDSINYLLENSEIEKCFSLVHNYLYPQGLFIFDFNTVHKYRDIIGDSTIAEVDEDCSFIWDNFFNEEDNVNEYDLTLFIKEDASEFYRKETETHYQRGYEVDEMCDFLKGAGLDIIALIDEKYLEREGYKEDLMIQAGRGNMVMMGINDESQRVLVIARK